jgi:hypothetical protein
MVAVGLTVHRIVAAAVAYAGVVVCSALANAASIGGCKFDTVTHQFKGGLSEQAECLLRKVKPKGSGATNQPIPGWLNAHIGTLVTFTKASLGRYLTDNGIATTDITVSLNPGDAPDLRYFVIHDTSSPEEPQASGFPSNIDSPDYAGNKLSSWTGRITQRVNVIVTRDGRSKVFQDWAAKRPLAATKLELQAYAKSSKKYFVHVENVQPRLKPAHSFAWIAPDPGLSAKQEQRLAVAYVVASFRAGSWLVPAYHFNIDEGLPEGHDDPQNTDLASWVGKIEQIESSLK